MVTRREVFDKGYVVGWEWSGPVTFDSERHDAMQEAAKVETGEFAFCFVCGFLWGLHDHEDTARRAEGARRCCG